VGIGALGSSSAALREVPLLLRPHIRPGLLEHDSGVFFCGFGDVRIREGRSVPAENAVVVLLRRCRAVGWLV